MRVMKTDKAGTSITYFLLWGREANEQMGHLMISGYNQLSTPAT